jgi:hypothetical protein
MRWREGEYRGYLLEFRRRHLCSQKAGEEDEVRARARVRVSVILFTSIEDDIIVVLHAQKIGFSLASFKQGTYELII